jgi:hypothetical protein
MQKLRNTAAQVKKFPLHLPSEVSVREVTTKEEYQSWGEVIGATCGFDEESLQGYMQCQSSFGPGKSQPVKNLTNFTFSK